MIHLDTSFLIRALVRDTPEDEQIRIWLRDSQSMAMSLIAWTEFLCGPVESTHVQLAARIVTACIPFGEEHARLSAQLFNLSGRRRGTLIDCMIAATALHDDAALATSNPSDFTRLSTAGLDVLAVS